MIKRIIAAIGISFLFSTGLFAQNLDAISLKKGMKLSGGFDFSNTFFSGNSGMIHRAPYIYFLRGNLNVNMFGFDLPFSFAYSNTSKSYTQPFNRFQFAPKYKWAKLYVGSTSMDFSKYTLAGHQFTGAGVELTPGKWSISAMYGRLLKAIEYDPLLDNLYTASFKRMGYGMKVGYADKGDEVNVIFFSAKDDVNSLKYHVPDEADLHPMQNTSISVYGKKAFLKHFFVQAEYALSTFNSELRSETGEVMTTANLVNKLFGGKGSRYLDAVNASVGFQNPLWGVLLGYERVSPNYQTLGGYYFTNDVEIFKVAPNVKLWNGKLNLAGSLGLEYNDLDNTKGNNTNRTVGSANATFSPNEAWNATIGYSNFSTYTKVKPQAYPYYVDNLDSLNFYQVTQTFNGTVSYSFGKKEKLMNTLMTTASYQTGSSKAGNVQGNYSNFLTVMCSFGEQWIPKNLSWAAFFSLNYADATDLQMLYWGPGVSLSKSFLKNTLTGGLTCNYNQSTMDGLVASSLLNTSLSLQYSLQGIDKKLGKHGFSLNSGLTNYLGTETDRKRQYEWLTTITYNVKF
jgi:hypothetical protein